jgi:hypothetical protein
MRPRLLYDGSSPSMQIKSLPVYGVAIPTVLGLRNVFGAMNAQNGEHSRDHYQVSHPALLLTG